MMEYLRAVSNKVTEELNVQFIEKLNDKGEDIGKLMQQQQHQKIIANL